MKFNFINSIISILLLANIIIFFITKRGESPEEIQLKENNEKMIKEQRQKALYTLKYSLAKMPEMGLINLELDSINFKLNDGILLVLSNENCSDCIHYIFDFIKKQNKYSDFHTIIQNQTQLAFVNQFKNKYSNIYLDNFDESKKIVTEDLAHVNPVLFLVRNNIIIQCFIVYDNNVEYLSQIINKFEELGK